MLRVKVKAVGLEQASMQPVVILTDLEERGFIPLVIGAAEANAISLLLEGVSIPRPITHQLLHNIISKLNAVVQKVVITDLVKDTYYAIIYLKADEQEGMLEIDARPSDSIALALNSDSPIYISEKIAAKAMVSKPIEESEIEDFKKFLEDISPEDFRGHHSD